MFRLSKFFLTLLTFVALLGLVGIVATGILFLYYSKGLPDHHQLAQYNPPTITRLYAADGQVIGEYATEKRLYVPIDAMPKRLLMAFIAAEDKNFYNHPGVDVTSIAKAAARNILNMGTNRSISGGSTITQQVVKNFLLTNERSLERKIREAILAFRITKTFSKDRILELYLNQIYLGNRSYGAAAAALNYFNKSVGELAIEEVALLASLPKAPSSLDPFRYPERALERRNWVIERMEEEGFITEVDAVLASAKPITLTPMPKADLVNAGFFTDTVRQQLISLYSEEQVDHDGFAVRTTLEPTLQRAAEITLLKGLRDYDHRHGWRGPLKQIDIHEADWKEIFFNLPERADLGVWSMAIVTRTNAKAASILLRNNKEGIIPLKNLTWARTFIHRNALGSTIQKPEQVLKPGDIIAVHFEKEESGSAVYTLEQIPQVNGAIVAMNPHTGRIQAMVGGYYYGDSQFNRAVQANRQPGSAFKPFVYLAALEKGFYPNSIIIDEEIQFDQGGNLGVWRPQNHTDEYYGPTTLRVGVEKSRNVMTVRLSQMMGLKRVLNVANRFKIYNNPPANLSVALGSHETTLLQLTNAYAMLVNGGKEITPALIERIQDRTGKTIYKRDQRSCTDCQLVSSDIAEDPIANDQQIAPPFIVDQRPTITDPIVAYQMVSILEGVVQRGTATQAKTLGYSLAGKTGTTNDSFDSWFVGFSPDLVVGVYAGFDQPATLGSHEYGATIALPVWIDFMQEALKTQPDIPFRRPDGVKLVKVDINTGLLPSPTTNPRDIIFEAFRAGTEPTSSESTTFSTLPDQTGQGMEELESGTIY